MMLLSDGKTLFGICTYTTCPIQIDSILLYRCFDDLSIPADLFSAVIFRARIDNFAPVKVAAVECGNQRFRRCDVGCDRNVVKVAQTEQILIVFAAGGTQGCFYPASALLRTGKRRLTKAPSGIIPQKERR